VLKRPSVLMRAVLAKTRPSVVIGAALAKTRPSVVMRAALARTARPFQGNSRSAQDGIQVLFPKSLSSDQHRISPCSGQ
jgi:hypothetical protein